MLDVNDNRPIFLHPRGGNTTQEIYFGNLKAGSVISQIIAIDNDIGQNSKIEFKMIDISNTNNNSLIHKMFNFDQHTGLILSKRNITEQNLGLYKLLIEACDHGYPTKFCETAVLTIRISDEKDLEEMVDGISSMISKSVILENRAIIFIFVIIISVITFIGSVILYFILKFKYFPFENFENSASSLESSRKPSRRNEYTTLPLRQIHSHLSNEENYHLINPITSLTLLNFQNSEISAQSRNFREIRLDSVDTDSCCINETERNRLNPDNSSLDNCEILSSIRRGTENDSLVRGNMQLTNENDLENINNQPRNIPGITGLNSVNENPTIGNSTQANSDNPFRNRTCTLISHSNSTNFSGGRTIEVTTNQNRRIARSEISSLSHSAISLPDVENIDNYSLNDAKSYMPVRNLYHHATPTRV